ncbi:MAG TPA: hypothetical protein VFF73_10775 [Planctomycetota bacterium]|nr:hypothetical protein [Planctomycetota bacterium]
MSRPVLAGVALLALASGCVPLRPTPVSTGPVVVVGRGPDRAAARERALDELLRRMRSEIERREALAPPAERVRDWRAVDCALERALPELARDVAFDVGSDSVVSIRIADVEFEAALAAARAEGRRGPLRVACVPLAVLGDRPALFTLRELYGSALREALTESGLEPLSTDEVYAALERAHVLSLDEEGAARLARAVGADAVIGGTVRFVEPSLTIEVVLRDARGRRLGGFGGEVDPAEILAVARRQALVLKRGLGVGP